MDNCKRCATCCRKGGPALHGPDAELVRQGVLSFGDLVTFRRGELCKDPVREGVLPIEEEIIKVRGRDKGTWACRFLDDNLCSIYETRPAECSALDCWDTTRLEMMYDQDRLSRRDLVEAESGMAKLMDEHEEHCSYIRVAQLAVPARDGAQDALEELLSMIRYDDSLRRLVEEKTGAPQEMLEFFFGRPMRETIETFGLRISIQGDRTILVRK